jgi:hypothetical protein
MNSTPSSGESIGYNQSAGDQQKTDQLTTKVNGNLDQFNGPVQGTPYYKSLLQSGTDSTNSAYNNATRNLKMSMEGAGVGGASGAVQGNTAAMGAQRAGDLAKVGPAATEGATNMQMQGNAQALQEAGMYSGAGLGYYSGASQAENARLASQGSMWEGLLAAGMGAGSSMYGSYQNNN